MTLPPKNRNCNTDIQAEMAHNLLEQEGRSTRYLDAKLTFEEGKTEVTEN